MGLLKSLDYRLKKKKRKDLPPPPRKKGAGALPLPACESATSEAKPHLPPPTTANLGVV
jgi:hypothetical protein